MYYEVSGGNARGSDAKWGMKHFQLRMFSENLSTFRCNGNVQHELQPCPVRSPGPGRPRQTRRTRADPDTAETVTLSNILKLFINLLYETQIVGSYFGSTERDNR